MKFKDLFMLSWRKFSIVAIIFIAFFFYRNLWGRLTGISGLMFRNLALVIFIYLIICLVYTLMKRKEGRKKMRKKKESISSSNIFLLTWKKFSLTLIIWIVAVIIHNFGSALIGFEEPVFFIIAVIIIPLYLIISIVYSLIYKIKKRENKKR